MQILFTEYGFQNLKTSYSDKKRKIQKCLLFVKSKIILMIDFLTYSCLCDEVTK